MDSAVLCGYGGLFRVDSAVLCVYGGLFRVDSAVPLSTRNLISEFCLFHNSLLFILY